MSALTSTSSTERKKKKNTKKTSQLNVPENLENTLVTLIFLPSVFKADEIS
jgi:hypothetical protein